MQPRARSIFDLFDGKRRYVVPMFQRQYVWGEELQWEPLWDDILRKFLDRLEEKEGPPHFLGAMVLDQARVYGNAVQTNLIIDGQQRLTTFQIFLSAFRDACAAHGQQKYADECQRYLLNDGIMEDPASEQYKVWPSNLDRAPFRAVVSAGSRAAVQELYPLTKQPYARKYDPRPAIVECYFFFRDAFDKLFDVEAESVTKDARAKAMHDALRLSLQVVTIELEGNDDPQVIFESLNARGAELLPSDLLRNFILWRAARNKEPQDELYEQHWLPFDSDQFWQQKETRGRMKRPRSDIFFSHYLTLRRQREVSTEHLYAEFKYWAKSQKRFSTVRAELEDISRVRGFYRKLVEPDVKTPLGTLARALQVFDTTTVYPLVLALMERDVQDDERAGMFVDLESYIVRRSICGYTAKNYNRTFLSILSRLPEQGLTREGLRGFLVELMYETAAWPRDDVFRKAWLERPFYDQFSAGRVQYVLRSIEQRLRESVSEEVEILSPLTVEHVLPQGWEERWPLPNGSKGVTWTEKWEKSRDVADIEATDTRDRLMNTMGNLTLLTQPLNSAISNAPFGEKKPEIVRQSALALNRYFHDVDSWNEETIVRRGELLFEHARVIWPHIG